MIDLPFVQSPLLASGPSGWTLITMIPALIAAVVAGLAWKQSKVRDATTAEQAERQNDIAQFKTAFEMQKSIADQAMARAERAEVRAAQLEKDLDDLRAKLDEQIALNKAYRGEFDQYRFEALTRQDEMRHQLDAALVTINNLQRQIELLQK